MKKEVKAIAGDLVIIVATVSLPTAILTWFMPSETLYLFLKIIFWLQS